MVESVVRPVSWSAGKPVRGIRPVAAFAPYKQLSSLLSQLKAEEEEEEQPTSGQERSSAETLSWIEDALDSSVASELELMFDQGYRTWIRFFLTPNHDEILAIRSRIREGSVAPEGDGSSRLLPVPYPDSGNMPNSGSQRSHKEREQLYRVQMQLYRTEKGLHCHIIV